jgi:hypothetical protein
LLAFTEANVFINHAVDAKTSRWKSRLLPKLDGMKQPSRCRDRLRTVKRLQRSVEVLVWRYSDAGLADPVTVEHVDAIVFQSYGTSIIVRSSVVVVHGKLFGLRREASPASLRISGIFGQP